MQIIFSVTKVYICSNRFELKLIWLMIDQMGITNLPL